MKTARRKRRLDLAASWIEGPGEPLDHEGCEQALISLVGQEEAFCLASKEGQADMQAAA